MLEASKLLRRPESLALLEKLPAPSSIWKYFLLCTETPRPSHKLDNFRKILSDLAPALDCESAIDSAGNLRFRKKASPGCENAPRICIQAHLDMVTSANSDMNFNFDTDPINVFLADKNGKQWLQANGTTLGADNGMGLAAGLAVLEASKEGTLQHGEIEVLLTADEETTMGGAENLEKAPFLISDILLNVDSEEENSICIGCAGGMENDFTIQVNRENSLENRRFLSIYLRGLLGGHSGIEIHTGRANALKSLNKLVRLSNAAVNNQAAYVSFLVEGAPNVIPREARATVAVPSDLFDQFQQALDKNFQEMKEDFLSVEFRIDEQGKKQSVMILDVNEAADNQTKPLTVESSNKVSDLIESYPSGVIRMNYDVKDLVETSINFASASIKDSEFAGHSFARSSAKRGLPQIQDQLEALLRISGGNISKMLNSFPGWDPDVSSVSLTEMKATFVDVLQLHEPRIYAVHAGLECGFVQAAYPNISCISIGPEIHHAHSPDECLLIESVKRFYDLTIRFIERISKLQR